MQERIPPVLYELTFVGADKALAMARAVLQSAGIDAALIIEDDQTTRRSVKFFSENKVYITRLHQLFERLCLPGVKISLKPLRPKQWLTRWKIGWRPAALTRHLDVVPLWHRKTYRPKSGRDHILINTLLSFGTGLHETTRFMAQFIEDCRGQFSSFMDIGTGTGILAMTALKNGARRVVAIDIGELSVEAAKANLKVNRLKAVVKKADIKTFRHKGRYDFVAANLVTQDLIEFRRQILTLAKPGGYLAVSGISLENLPKFQRAFSQLPLNCLDIQKGKQWAGLLFQKRTS